MSLLRSGLSAWAAMLVASSPAWAGAVDFQPIVGSLQSMSGAGSDATGWRDVGFRARSAWADAEVRLPACVALDPTAVARVGHANLACRAFESGSSSLSDVVRREVLVTAKVPRWVGYAPFIDLQVRRWDAAIDRSSDPRDARKGTAANLLVTQAMGPVDASVGYEVPIGASGDASRWRTLTMGLAWYGSSGLAVEFSGERAVEQATRAIDRAMTVRTVHRFKGTSARLSTWVTRRPDRSDASLTAGISLRMSF